jgi:hypothetical protein
MADASYILQIRSDDVIVAELPVCSASVSCRLIPVTNEDDEKEPETDSSDPVTSSIPSFTPNGESSGFDEVALYADHPFEDVECTLRTPTRERREQETSCDEGTAQLEPTEPGTRSVPAEKNWEMDEDEPLDVRPIPALRCVDPRVQNHVLRPEPVRLMAWNVGFVVMAILAFIGVAAVGTSSAMQEVSSELVRVTYPPPQPLKVVKETTSEPRRKTKKPRKKSRARTVRQQIPEPPSAPSPTAKAEMDDALAAMKLLQEMPTTNLSVVSSPSRGGTKTAGVVVPVKPGARIQTGVGQIGVNTDARTRSDSNSSVAASKVSRQGRVVRPKPREISVEGSLSKESIQAVVQRNLGQIRSCYERNLLKNPDMTGKIVAQWRIETSGTTSKVSAGMDSLSSPATTACVLQAIRGWRFQAPKGGSVRVAYPFNFSSTGA